MFKEEANSNVTPEKKCTEYSKMPDLVEYIYKNVPLKALPLNGVGIFIEDAFNVLDVIMVNTGIKLPIIIYKVSGKSYNFLNYKLELVGGWIFLNDFKCLRTFGIDFKKQDVFFSYKLMSFDFNYSETISLIEKKFQTKNVIELNK